MYKKFMALVKVSQWVLHTLLSKTEIFKLLWLWTHFGIRWPSQLNELKHRVLQSVS